MLKRSIFITLMLALWAAAISAQQSVGSEHWFQTMRQTAANLAMMKSLTGTRDYRKLPADYVEFAGRIAFPNGNPFPKGRLPDLRIVCHDLAADGVDRAPLVGEDGGFYTVFKRGETYDLYWMYYFGSREKFASVTIRAEGPRQRRLTIEYRLPDAAVVSSEGANAQSAESGHHADEVIAVAPRANSTLVVDPDEYDLSAFPHQVTNFEQQQVLEDIRSATTPALKAGAHERLARYYEKRGDSWRARAEYAKARYWAGQK